MFRRRKHRQTPTPRCYQNRSKPYRSTRTVGFECLEGRNLLAGLPFGAAADDTAEFLLGDVLVTVVLMESSETTNANNANTETWTPASIATVKQKVIDGMTWWEDALAAQTDKHSLNFEYDFTYADNPVETEYEPIANISNRFSNWIYDFLTPVGFDQTGSFGTDIRAFNHSQRTAFNTDWAFTIFVVNDENDEDGFFASGGSFRRAFAFPGGEFYITPAGRPVSTYSHEMGHIFWARDEYAGAGSYTDRRGYYNSQNLNAYNNPTPGFVQQPSIMGTGDLLDAAFQAHTSSVSSFEMVGWRDSDNNGVFDVLDVPHTLSGSGYFDPDDSMYRFVGSSSVQTLPNRNSSGNQNDITINRISRAEYRIDGGDWQTAATYDTFTAELDLAFAVPPGQHVIEIRTVDDVTGVSSPIFQGTTERPSAVLRAGINGFVWDDVNGDGQFDVNEQGLEGWTVRLIDEFDRPIDLVQRVEPDDHGNGALINEINSAVTLTAIGDDVDANGSVASGPFNAGAPVDASTGDQTFYHFTDTGNGWSGSWTTSSRQLRMDFSTPTSVVKLDAIGNSNGDFARLEAYDVAGNLIARYTTGSLTKGQVETMAITRSSADISFAIARGHMGTAVNLDNLRFGPESSTVTDSSGAYSLAYLPTDDYLVEVVPPAGWVASAPLNGTQNVSFVEGEAEGDVDFGAQSVVTSWQNPTNRFDVDNNGAVQALDVLLVVNYVNENAGDVSLPAAPATPPPFYDIDGNGIVTALDVLQVVNHINTGGAEGEGDSVPEHSRPSPAKQTASAQPVPETATGELGAVAPALAFSEPQRPAPATQNVPNTNRAAAPPQSAADAVFRTIAMRGPETKDGWVTPRGHVITRPLDDFFADLTAGFDAAGRFAANDLALLSLLRPAR